MLKLNNIFAALLYTSMSLTAIAAQGFDLSQVEDLREGKMRGLVFHEVPEDVSDKSFQDADGNPIQLSDYNGKYVLLNFWATWCAPCRHEMPAINQLSNAFSGEAFAVVPLASGHNPLPAIRKFYQENALNDLPIMQDPRSSFSRDMGVLSLPITILINPEGKEIARMKGDADWFSQSAQDIIQVLVNENLALQ
jgi:thiol-disulfide isomerase/thioredoxin